MPTYIILMNYTEQGIKNIKEAPERTERLTKTLESMGGKVIGHYAVMGQWDRISIVEMPSDDVMASAALRMGAGGIIRTMTLKAWPMADFSKIIRALP